MPRPRWHGRGRFAELRRRLEGKDPVVGPGYIAGIIAGSDQHRQAKDDDPS